MTARKRIAVVGATGRAGRHTVDALEERGHEVVRISRSLGVDVITGEGLDAALVGVEAIVDAATGPSPEQVAATEFFTTAARNLQAAGSRAGVQRLVVVSIIATDRTVGGYGKAKVAHEEASLAGPIPAVVLRAAQFHELVGQMVDWGRQGEVAYVPQMRTQLVAARTVGEALADLAVAPVVDRPGEPALEIAGPREESLVDAANLLVARRGETLKIEGVSRPDDPDAVLQESGAMLPSRHAMLAGPTFEEWLESGAG